MIWIGILILQANFSQRAVLRKVIWELAFGSEWPVFTPVTKEYYVGNKGRTVPVTLQQTAGLICTQCPPLLRVWQGPIPQSLDICPNSDSSLNSYMTLTQHPNPFWDTVSSTANRDPTSLGTYCKDWGRQCFNTISITILNEANTVDLMGGLPNML